MMESLFMVLLLLVVGSSHGDSSYDTKTALETWFQDPDARQAFGDIWKTDEYPLAKVINASTYSDPKEITSECLGAINYLGDLSDMAAYNMLDSSAKIPEGLLMLSWMHFGNWDECVGVRDVDGPTGRFHGKMCMVAFPPVLESGSEAAAPQTREALEMMQTYLSLKLGQCVPSICTANDVELIYKSLTANLPTVKEIGLSASVAEIDCTTQDKPKLDTSDWVAVGLLIALGVVVVTSTVYDLLMPEKNKKNLLAAFSVVANGKKLLAVPNNKGDQTLSSLHGLRFLSMCWVILGHRYMTTGQTAMINRYVTTGIKGDWYRIALTNATLSVDSFFVFSGLLVGYLFFKQAPPKRKLNIPLYYIHRYIRLTPALAMVVLLTATLGYRVGWGPIWQTTLVDKHETCRTEWWNTLLYISNYVTKDQCVAQSWYLMIDMQLHWISPIFLLITAARPKWGMILLGVLCGASVIENFLLSYLGEMEANLMSFRDIEKRNFFNKYYYTATYGRFVPYLEGLALGYILGNQKYLQQKPKKLSFLHGAAAWLLVAALLLVPLFTGLEFVEHPLPSKTAIAFYNALNRVSWGLGVAGVVYMCASGNGGPVNTLLSWWGFQLFGRFSYCMYLVHLHVFEMMWANMRTPGYFSDDVILAQYAADLLICMVFAGVLSVLCESPFIVIEKELLGNRQNKSAPSNTNISAPNVNSPSSIEITMGEKSQKEKD